MASKSKMPNHKRKDKRQAKRELNVRQAQVLTYLALGKRVREIAQELGVSDDSIRRDIRRLEETKTYDNRLKVELEKHCLLWNKAFACVEANLDSGNLKAAEDVMKYTGVWIDRLDVIAKVEPGDQQKKMMENIKTLLKLSSDKVKVALPEKAKESKRVEVEAKMVDQSKKIMDTEPAYDGDYDGDVAGMVKTKETETQSQRACICDKVGHEAWCPSHPHMIESEEKDKKKTEETEIQSRLGSEKMDCGASTIEPAPKEPKEYRPTPNVACTCGGWGEPPQPKCPVHGDKEQGGGHPPPGGSDA